MVKLAPDQRSTEAIARRLRLTRKALGLQTQGEFADRAGIRRNAFSPFYLGKRPLTIVQALKLCEEFGLTLDWLYRGDLTGLPHQLATELSRLAKRSEN